MHGGRRAAHLEREHVLLEEQARACLHRGLHAVLRAAGRARERAEALRERVVLRERVEEAAARVGRLLRRRRARRGLQVREERVEDGQVLLNLVLELE
jgi:hypothetical protein